LCKEHQLSQLNSANVLRVIGPVSNTEVQSGRMTYFVEKQCGRNKVLWPTCDANSEEDVGTHCSVRRPFINHFKLEGMALNTCTFCAMWLDADVMLS